jgi:hypothetical protein
MDKSTITINPVVGMNLWADARYSSQNTSRQAAKVENSKDKPNFATALAQETGRQRAKKK